MYTHGHDNMNHHQMPVGISPSRYSAPPSTSSRSDAKHNPLTMLQSHQLSMIHSAASLPHLPNISTPPPASHSAHGPSAALPSSSTPTSSFSSMKRQPLPTDNATYSHLPKHWVWNSSFFYPHSRPTQEGFQPYLSGNSFGGLFAASSPPSKSVVDLSQSMPTMATNNTGSDVTSEDSFDPEDGRHSYRTPPPSPHTPPESTGCPQVDNDPGFNRKKRNPYSIEELLKKPDPKRVRRPSIATTFRPSIIIEDRSRSRSSSDTREMSPELIVESSRSGSEDGCYKNDPIEICD